MLDQMASEESVSFIKTQLPRGIEQPSCAGGSANNLNNNNVFETDQDTIIDQDDDVAEECSVADQ